MKENQHVQPVIDTETETVTFNVRGKPSLVLDWSKLHPTVQMKAGLVGMAQVRIVDAAAIGRADAEGNLLGEQERIDLKYARMAALIEHYHTGTDQWTLSERGGTGAQGLTLMGIAAAKSISYGEAERLVDAYAARQYAGDRKAALNFLAKGSRVRTEIEKIRVKRAGESKVDADEALNEI